MSESDLNFLDRDYTFNFEKYLNRGWDIFRQYAGGFIGFLVLNIALSISLSFLPESQERIATTLYNLASPVLTAGYSIVAIKIAQNKSKSFADFFDGFKRFVPIFLVNLVGGLLVGIGILLLVIPGIYLAIAYSFAILFVIEYRLNFWTALETSRKVVGKKWFAFFGFIFVLGLINLAGVLALGIGLFVTIPFTLCAIVAAFEDIVGWKTVDLEKAE